MASRPLSAPPHLRRLKFGHFSEADVANAALRKRILARDNNRCVDCGLVFSRHMEVRHLDDDHENSDESNLVCVCPFCHCRDHLHTTGFARAGVLMGSTYLTQGVINSISIACWYIFSRVPNRTDIRVLPEEGQDALQQMRMTAQTLYSNMHTNGLRWADVFGSIPIEPDAFGEALADLFVKSPEAYAARGETTKHLHFLPTKEAFAGQCEDWFRYLDKARPLPTWTKGLDSWMERMENAGTSAEEVRSLLSAAVRQHVRGKTPANELARPLGKPPGPFPSKKFSGSDSSGPSIAEAAPHEPVGSNYD